MTYRVVLTERAERDRDSAFAWYRENYSVDFAARWYDRISHAIQGLSSESNRCGVAHENDKFPFELRELLCGGRRHKHRLLFTIHGKMVLVLHIRHSAQRDLTLEDL